MRSDPPEQHGEVMASSSLLWNTVGPDFGLNSARLFIVLSLHISHNHGGLSGRHSNLGKHEDIKLYQEESAMQLPQCLLGNMVKNGKRFQRMISTVPAVH